MAKIMFLYMIRSIHLFDYQTMAFSLLNFNQVSWLDDWTNFGGHANISTIHKRLLTHNAPTWPGCQRRNVIDVEEVTRETA